MDNKCKKRGCPCLRYRAKENEKDECVFCNHSIGFHEFPSVNINEHPYGRCNEDDCDCQRYKEETLYKCTYCGHPLGFHHRWNHDNTQITSIAVPSSTITTQITPLPHARNISRNAGRPRTDRVTIKHLICFDKALSNRIPKKGTSLWLNLKNKNLIKENIKIFKATPEEIYNNILNLFSEELNGQGWILYSASSGQPIKVNGEISFDLIKSHTTKAMKKLYIGPSDYNIANDDSNLLLPQVNMDNSVDVGNAGTSANMQNMQIINLPLQSSSVPEVDDFFNGFEDEFDNYITLPSS
ncbi:uncharacterized protein OCT59_010485 [Rhizophagus irregularis]|nr:hypothetical protein RirG_040710 [Rhizophagus irregularis DAOM 197198w]UZO19186.1 hypothetical protein OCT59_010485 [Rhizophagus irregularis]CAB4400628.1 unnamed protein product [Rhizophagus irregularis]CAB4491987.1 unnamed protein product [Rhizophagus irregularis]CAB4491988.1 unnamed protein product [Rhizophagus irregularis]